MVLNPSQKMHTAAPALLFRRSRVSVFGAFFLNGFALATWIVNIPAVSASSHIDNAVLGTTLLSLGFGSLLAMQASGYLSAFLGSRFTVAAGVVLIAAGLFGLTFVGDAWELAGALFVLGLGNGCIDVGMNDQAVAVERRYNRPIMSAFHGFFSVGGAVGAGVGALLQRAEIDFNASLRIAAIGVVALGVASIVGLLNRENVQAEEKLDLPPAHTSSAQPPIARRAVILGVLAFAVMLGEGAVNDWSALHATQHLGQSASAASLPFFFFALTMTLGRLVMDRVAHAIGPVRVVRWGSAVAAVGLGTVIASPLYPLTILGWMIFGVGIAGIVPQVFTAAGALAPGRRGSIILSRVVSGGYFGQLAGPALVGWVSVGIGINLALLVPLFLLAAGIVAARVVSVSAATDSRLTSEQ